MEERENPLSINLDVVRSHSGLLRSCYLAGLERIKKYNSDASYRRKLGSCGYRDCCISVRSAELELMKLPRDVKFELYSELLEEQRRLSDMLGVFSDLSLEEWLEFKESADFAVADFYSNFILPCEKSAT